MSILQPIDHHLAQLNVGRILDETDSPQLAEFMSNLDRVNAIADRSPGFVWRLVGDVSNNATDLRPTSDTRFLLNMSVWETAETLEHFVWSTIHKRFYEKKANWFDAMSTPHFVMWWVPTGHRPSADEALARLDHLTRHGPSDQAFGWESLPNFERLTNRRCA